MADDSGTSSGTQATPPPEGVDEVLHERSLRELGVTGVANAPPLRATLRDHGISWYPLIALGVLAVVDEFQSWAFLVLGPEISFSLGVSKPVLAALVALKTLALTTAALPMAAWVQHGRRRARLAIATAFLWSILTGGTAFVASVWGLLFILVADGATTGSVRAVHEPLLFDTYPPAARVRALAFYRAANASGNVIAAGLVAILTTVFLVTWRGVLLTMGILSLLAAIAAVRLKDPGYGKWDTERIREHARAAAGAPETAEELPLRFSETVRRLLTTPTVRRVLISSAALGMMIVPLYTFLFFFLAERWRLGPGGRGVFFACVPLLSFATLLAFGRYGEAQFRRDPRNLVSVTAALMAAGGLLLGLGAMAANFAVMVLAFAGAFSAFATLFPGLSALLFTVTPARARPHVAALQGIFMAGVGGFAGVVVLGGLERRFGTAGAIASLTIPALAAALILLSVRRTVRDDLDRMIAELLEQETTEALLRQGVRLPLLACRGVNFSYGLLQVLFDIDFSVDEGEMVALLGTNGAGKSTLLHVASGLALPQRGSVRLEGRDITYLDTDRRLQLGIAQIPGGRAVFGPLTVVENLRLFGFGLGHDRALLDRGIAASFEAFPRLAERRNQPAATLSGGEQQMLALSKALLLQPRILLIDELSLGLAPKVVTELLGMVRRINAAGTAVVLVEQSVNVALSIADHAYFMEKGQISFDGSAKDLLDRKDLLRSVFLEGAARRLG